MRRISLAILVICLFALGLSGVAFCKEQNKGEFLKEYLDKKDPSERQKILDRLKKEEKAGYSTPETYKEKPPYELLDQQEELWESVKEEEEKDTTSVLKPFGMGMFEVPPDMAMPSEVADMTDYILGPGDNIIIYLWGKVEKEYNLTIGRRGNVFIPNVGETTAWGMTLEEFERNVKKRFLQVYSDFNISVSLGKIRSIRVYLTGEVHKPGAYTVSSLATLFNALYLAGGPNERGSMRKVKLMRGSKVEQTVDLYQFLLKGDNRSDVRMSSGDAIFIPVTGSRVTISGEVMRPAIYELKGEEKVSDLLELAGGPTAIGYLDRILLNRISPNDERIVVDLNMNPNNGLPIDNIELVNGDELTLFSVYEMIRNHVCIAGAVKHPLRFERTDSTTLKDLISLGVLLPSNVHFERANLFRHYPDQRVELIPINLNKVLSGETNILLQDLDSLHVYAIDEVKGEKVIYIDGEVANPGEYRLYENMSLADLIFMAGGLKKNAYRLNVELARNDYCGKVDIQRVDLDNSNIEALLLQEDDHVFIREIPNWFLNQTVTLEGEVKFPGEYALLSRSETLYDLLKRSNWFTERAFPEGIIFQRKSIGESLIRQKLPEIIASSQPMVEDSLGNVKRSEQIRFRPENLNRIIIDMVKLISTNGKEGDITLQDKDHIYVPEIPTGISVMGAVGAEGTIKYEIKKKVEYYVRRAGSMSRLADKGALKLIKAGGQVFAGRGVMKKKVDIGDAIVVPTAIRKDRDWLKTISAVVSIVGGILTSVFVIEKI